jgi:ethanolamine utilization protein EutQ
MKRLITAEVVAEEFAAGRTRIAAAGRECIVTPDAWSKAAALGVTIDQGALPSEGSCERITDPSGVTVVRGRSVQLGRFDGAPGDVGLLDLITSKQSSPMTAGIMSWSAQDSFAWKLDYDEIDYVLEGTLTITIDGRTIEGRTGDVLHIPKGSRVVFGTPNRTRVFYVTYPADWAAQR